MSQDKQHPSARHAIDVHRVAHLARLALSPEQEARLETQLGAVLEYIAVLEQVDTSGVPPTSHPLPLATPFRADEVAPSLDRDVVLAQAPKTDGESFAVPRVV